MRQRVERRIVDWCAGQYKILVKDTTCTSCAMVLKVARGVSEEAISTTFTSLVLKGKIRTVVRFATLRRLGGVFLPDNIEAKLGRPVVDLLQEKHPAPIVSDVKVLEHYDVVPEFVLINITEDTVKQVFRRLTGRRSR